MGRAAAASGQRDPFAVDEDAALAELELAWADGGYHAFSAGGGTWCAVSSAGEVLAGDTPDALDRAIRAHWQAMQWRTGQRISMTSGGTGVMPT